MYCHRSENLAASIRAETEKRTTEIATNASVQVSRNVADGVRARAAAEAEASAKLRAKRDYEIESRRILTVEKLAGNPQLAISTDTGQNVVAQYFASQQTAATLGLLNHAQSS